ncbi:HemY protein [Enterovirga rhinocerotis]|uniref:HemY protein n=1 Tax=Enterovirga rhinocerotis TaxID=1339210 RepID=A0A4R7BUU8_9HYPH|nr:HemY protein [Enterovirga rhinocerotis]
MWRVLLYLALVGLAAWGAVWLASNPETLSMTWRGTEYSVSLAVGVTGLVAAALLIAFVLALIRGVIRLPFTLRRHARGRKEKRGYTALSRGIVAVGAGDVVAARRYAGEAERLLGHQPLALLLKAQAAQASGDRDRAEATFREMAGTPETRVLGLRGLYLEARRRGDAASAAEHAEEAARIAPSVGWASDAVLEAKSAEGDWTGAVRMIERRSSLGLVDRATSRRQRAVLLTADAMQREASDPNGALATAEQAAKLAPDLVPAATLAGRLLSGKGDLKRAAKIIEAAWSAEPHPDLAGAYLNLRPGDSALDRMRRAETLAKLSSWSDEARFAVARAAIEARDFPKAREALAPLLGGSERPTVRLCMTMAEIEGRSGQAGAAREWLARAARAPRDKAWIADGYVSDRWMPVSPVTGRLDAFVWETPPEALGAPAEGNEAAFFEPEEPEAELPPFIGRTIAPPAPVAADPAPKAPPAPEPVPPAVPAPVSTPAAAATPVPAPVPAPVPPPAAKPPVPTSKAGPAAEPPKAAEPIKPEPPAPGKSAEPKDGKDAKAPAEIAPPAKATETAKPDTPNGSGPVRTRPAAEPEPVVFPVRHPPDDPGLEGGEDRRQRFRLRV